MPRVSVAFILFIGVTAAFDPEKHANWKLLPHDICGTAVNFRIIGGDVASLNMFPWLVRVGFTSEATGIVYYNCAGALISEDLVLTAAHCVLIEERYKVGPIRLGEHDDKTDPDCDGQVCAKPIIDVAPSNVILRKNVNDSLFQNDIALIRLKNKVQFSRSVAPICLGNKQFSEKNFSGRKAEIAGWGYYDLSIKKKSHILRYAQVSVLSDDSCMAYSQKKINLTSSHLCAGEIEGVDSCNGDSGGPLMIMDDLGDGPRYYLLGIVSFGPKNCGKSAFPGIYTKVSTFANWILDNLV